MLAAILTLFITLEFVYLEEESELEGTYFGPLYLAVSNIIVWILLFAATCSFVRMLNKRFGERKFSGPKCKFFIFLTVFSVSFLVRGTYDLAIFINDD